jgi:hypothetical protein
MQDEFDSGMDMPDDELTGGSMSETDMGDETAGGGDEEMGAEGVEDVGGRRSGGKPRPAPRAKAPAQPSGAPGAGRSAAPPSGVPA